MSVSDEKITVDFSKKGILCVMNEINEKIIEYLIENRKGTSREIYDYVSDLCSRATVISFLNKLVNYNIAYKEVKEGTSGGYKGIFMLHDKFKMKSNILNHIRDLIGQKLTDESLNVMRNE